MREKEIIKTKIENLINNKELKTKSYKAGDVIFSEGDECESLGYLYKGEITISTISDRDTEEVISIINDSDFFGQFLLFQEEKKYLGDVIAIKASKVVFINKNKLLEIMGKDKEFLEAYMKIISKESFKIKQQVKLLSHKNSMDRLHFYLKSNNKDGKIEIKSITSLSHELNLPRETVSRNLNKLIKDKKIIKDGSVYYIKL